MALTVKDVKGAQATSNVNSLALSAFSTDPVAGDVVAVIMASFLSGTAPTHTAPTDSVGGNTYTQIGTVQNITTSCEYTMWRSVLINGGASFVVTGHQTNAATTAVVAWCLTSTGGYNSDSVVANTAGTNPTSGTSTPAPPTGSMFIGGVTEVTLGDNAVADGSGWNAIANGVTSGMVTSARQTNNSTSQDLYTEYKMANIATAAIWSSASTTYIARVASFQPSAGGGASYIPQSRPFPFKPSSARSR